MRIDSSDYSMRPRNYIKNIMRAEKEYTIRQRRLYITLFESQLIRSYLSSDHGNFLKALSGIFEIVIVTNRQLYDSIKSEIARCNIDNQISVIFVPLFEESRLSRLVGSFLRWADSSPTTNLKIHWNLESTTFPMVRLVLRILLNRIFSSSNSATRLMRGLYLKSFRHSAVGEIMHLLDVENHDVLYITSLTNYWEDCLIGVSFRLNGNKIIASIRSWDNLVSHGRLRLVPDLFISHSEFVRHCAEEIQFIPSNIIVDGVTPTYQSIFLPMQKEKSVSKRRIIYASMGLTTNPDDFNFCLRLIRLCHELNDYLTLTILEHPKFPLGIDPASLPINTDILSFPYETSNIRDYYQILLNSDLILCGGTTAALDSCFVGANVALIAYEVVKQPYWQSALRYFDTRVHTKQFFELSNLHRVYNEDELMLLLRNEIATKSYRESVVEYFTGDKTKSFSNILINALEEIN